jgi:multidrug efflux system outer membrane protein
VRDCLGVVPYPDHIQRSQLDGRDHVDASLAAYNETRERREEQAAPVASAADAARLARLRYWGNTSYLEVLTTDTNLYDAQLQLAQSQQQEAASLVQPSAALGGGWQ